RLRNCKYSWRDEPLGPLGVPRPSRGAGTPLRGAGAAGIGAQQGPGFSFRGIFLALRVLLQNS
ncbi:MAG: hypothetical protein N2Z76_10230, partial [Treponemataceae bacterium]|nr:hypothetical protein [Treponemataceae bacterium]